MAVDHTGPRMYMDLPSPYKKDFGDAGFAPSDVVLSGDGMATCYDPGTGGSWTVPRDQWVALQIAWKLSTTSGWVRFWSDDTFIGQCDTTMPSGYEVGNWGIGNYWNGGAWIQNSSTDSFWMDDVVITKDTPNTTDAGDRPYIHSTHSPSDF